MFTNDLVSSLSLLPTFSSSISSSSSLSPSSSPVFFRFHQLRSLIIAYVSILHFITFTTSSSCLPTFPSSPVYYRLLCLLLLFLLLPQRLLIIAFVTVAILLRRFRQPLFFVIDCVSIPFPAIASNLPFVFTDDLVVSYPLPPTFLSSCSSAFSLWPSSRSLPL